MDHKIMPKLNIIQKSSETDTRYKNIVFCSV